VVPSLAEHPLPALVAAGISCSVSTDDPAMFDTDLSTEYAAVASIGVSAEQCFAAGVKGALCDEAMRDELRRIGEQRDWPGTSEFAREHEVTSTGRPPAAERSVTG
jgi:aminodeoxyfutalosine deaminase